MHEVAWIIPYPYLARGKDPNLTGEMQSGNSASVSPSFTTNTIGWVRHVALLTRTIGAATDAAIVASLARGSRK